MLYDFRRLCWERAEVKPLYEKAEPLLRRRASDPSHKPASVAEYQGGKSRTFWHFDGEMAMAVYAFHEGHFVLPDPGRATPVPADWPPEKK